jgi:hypothetical protein
MLRARAVYRSKRIQQSLRQPKITDWRHKRAPARIDFFVVDKSPDISLNAIVVP